MKNTVSHLIYDTLVTLLVVWFQYVASVFDQLNQILMCYYQQVQDYIQDTIGVTWITLNKPVLKCF